MKTGAIIGTVLAVTGLGTAAYFLLRKPAATVPSGGGASTTPGGTGTNILDLFNQVKALVPGTKNSNYEGKLIRIKKGKVFLVKDGLLRYVEKLREPWPPVEDLNSIPDGLAEGPPFTMQELTSMGLAGISSRLLQ